MYGALGQNAVVPRAPAHLVPKAHEPVRARVALFRQVGIQRGQEIPLSRELTAAGQTGLRLEALAVESRFAELFTDEEINACLERLIEAGYYKI